MVASVVQRGPHQAHIHAMEHAAEVLPAANRRQPGILVQVETQISTDHNSLVASSSSNVEQPPPDSEAEPMMPDIIEDNLHAQDIDMNDDQMSLIHSGPSTTHHGQMNDIAPQQAPFYMPLVSNMQWPMYAMATPATSALPAQISLGNASWNSQPSLAFQAEVFGAARQRQARRCHACIDAGRDGLNCPGNNNRLKCKYR